MAAKPEQIIDSLRAARSLEALGTVIRDLRDAFDVEHLVYHSINSTGEQYAALTYSDEWVAEYLARDYARVDPVVLGCVRRFHPVDWAQLDWSGRAARTFLGEARGAGVGPQGISVPIRGPNGQFALVTVSDHRPDAAWERYTAAHLRELILTAHFVNQTALEIERGTDRVATVTLSPREIDALTSLAVGRSRAQTAERLAISEHTLRVYIESARHKLGAQNTTHAVARALSLGLLLV